jgi:hypothetical protein
MMNNSMRIDQSKGPVIRGPMHRSLSQAARQALAVLQAGGKVSRPAKRLRLQTAAGKPATGITEAVLRELYYGGLLEVTHRDTAGNARIYALTSYGRVHRG